MGNRTQIDILSDYSGLGRSEKNVRRPKSLTQKIDFLDSSVCDSVFFLLHSLVWEGIVIVFRTTKVAVREVIRKVFMMVLFDYRYLWAYVFPTSPKWWSVRFFR